MVDDLVYIQLFKRDNSRFVCTAVKKCVYFELFKKRLLANKSRMVECISVIFKGEIVKDSQTLNNIFDVDIINHGKYVENLQTIRKIKY